jgi:ParB-like chromosome segregation protein Spo0J
MQEKINAPCKLQKPRAIVRGFFRPPKHAYILWLTRRNTRAESANSYSCKRLALREVRCVTGLANQARCHRIVFPVLSASASQLARNGTRRLADRDSVTGRDSVPLASVRQGDSPRLSGEDQEHVRRLAECDAAVLPPIVVHRPTMRVIDGMHRLRVAALQGRDRIDVEYFDGSEEEAFARAVELNVAHGLPLSLADRKAAAARILAWRPQMSDRAVAAMTGLSPKTVGAIRSRAVEEIPQLHERVGSDGRRHPLDGAEGRRRAAEALAARPDAPLREVAATAGVSAGTARRVRAAPETGRQSGRGRSAARWRGIGRGAAARRAAYPAKAP